MRDGHVWCGNMLCCFFTLNCQFVKNRCQKAYRNNYTDQTDNIFAKRLLSLCSTLKVKHRHFVSTKVTKLKLISLLFTLTKVKLSRFIYVQRFNSTIIFVQGSKVKSTAIFFFFRQRSSYAIILLFKINLRHFLFFSRSRPFPCGRTWTLPT